MRRLDLKKETLAQLTSDELVEVVGGTMPTKFDCTLSHQICLEMYRPTYRCFHTQEGGC